MPETVKAEEIKALLKLEPNQTCGFVRETYQSALNIAPGGLPAPFEDGRPLGTALYFMVTPQAPVKLHRIRNDQLYHYYLGDPLEVLLLYQNGDSELVIVAAPISSAATACSCSFPAAPSTPRASPANAAGSSAPAPNGLAWCRKKMSSSARRSACRQISGSRRRHTHVSRAGGEVVSHQLQEPGPRGGVSFFGIGVLRPC